MQRRRVATAFAVAAAGTALALPGSASAAPSCVGQLAAGPTSPPTAKAEFVTSLAGPGFGGLVSAFARADRTACPPVTTAGG
jgi:hypothetical protein